MRVDKAVGQTQFTGSGVYESLEKRKYEIGTDDLSGFAGYEQEIDAALEKVHAANS